MCEALLVRVYACVVVNVLGDVAYGLGVVGVDRLLWGVGDVDVQVECCCVVRQGECVRVLVPFVFFLELSLLAVAILFIVDALLDEVVEFCVGLVLFGTVCLLYTSPSPRDRTRSRMPSSA